MEFVRGTNTAKHRGNDFFVRFQGVTRVWLLLLHRLVVKREYVDVAAVIRHSIA